MKIAQIGHWFKTMPIIDFDSTQTLLEYDALIIDFSSVYNSSYPKDTDFHQKKKTALIEFLKFKKNPIVYISPRVVNGRMLQGSVGYNKNISDFLPVPYLEMELEKGKDFNIPVKTALSTFLTKYKGWFGYERYFKTNQGITIATTPLTNKILGFYDENCVFLPEITFIDRVQEESFLADLFEAIKNIGFQKNLNPLPKWTDSYSLPNEYETKQKISSIKQQVLQLETEMENSSALLENLIQKKRLFTATGDELEFEIEAIFKEFGFEILGAERNRDDLIVKYAEQIAVVEIKGLNSSAGEKNAAQLEKWRAIYLENTDINPKGILVVNAFRETPIGERNQEAFPDQMLRYAAGREHCLITTLQLLSIYYEVRLHPEKKQEIVESLFQTVGRYPDTYQWQNYIAVVINTDQDDAKATDK